MMNKIVSLFYYYLCASFIDDDSGYLSFFFSIDKKSPIWITS